MLSMFEMRERGYPDLIGILARSYLECWWIGVYLVLAPEEALDLLNAAHVHQLRKMDGTWGDLSYVINRMEVTGKTTQMNWKDLADRVDELYTASSPETVEVASRPYDILYRGIHDECAWRTGHHCRAYEWWATRSIEYW